MKIFYRYNDHAVDRDAVRRRETEVGFPTREWKPLPAMESITTIFLLGFERGWTVEFKGEAV